MRSVGKMTNSFKIMINPSVESPSAAVDMQQYYGDLYACNAQREKHVVASNTVKKERKKERKKARKKERKKERDAVIRASSTDDGGDNRINGVKHVGYDGDWKQKQHGVCSVGEHHATVCLYNVFKRDCGEDSCVGW